MFKKSKSKSNAQLGSKESIDSSRSNQSSSSGKNYSSGSLERLVDITPGEARAQGPFQLWFLGMVQDVNLGGTRQDADVQLIDKVEEAQLEGKISLVAKEQHRVSLAISKHGLKVMHVSNKEVLQRHPLHTVAQMVHYQDSYAKNNLALKVGQVGRTVYDVFVFQSPTEEVAHGLCEQLKRVFAAVTTHAA